MKRALNKKKKKEQLISFLSGAILVVLGTGVVLMGTFSVQNGMAHGLTQTESLIIWFSILLAATFILLLGTMTILFGRRAIIARYLLRNHRYIRLANRKITAGAEFKNVSLNKKAA